MDSKAGFNFTNEESMAFNKLKNRIENKYGLKEAEDYRLYRFLKARNFVVKDAEHMLIKHFEWKKNNKIDTILDDFKPSEVLQKYFQFNMIGCDTEGHPVVYCTLGSTDFRGLLKSQKKSHILMYVTYFLIDCEKFLQEQSRKYGRPVESWNAIMDVENLPLMQVIFKPTIDILLDALAIYEANFPERLKKCYVINVSRPFFIAYNAVKPIISGTTLRKTQFFGKENWKEVLLKIMDPDELPAFLGGNRTDPDGNKMCVTTVNHCGIVPEHYYFRSEERRLCGQPGVKTYELDRKEKVNISLDVVEPGSFIEWEFETENNDIAFGLFYDGKIEKKSKPVPLIATQRVNAHMQIETGKFLCQKSGTYILTLDNSYSWLRQKKIFCRTSITLTKTQIDIIPN